MTCSNRVNAPNGDQNILRRAVGNWGAGGAGGDMNPHILSDQSTLFQLQGGGADNARHNTTCPPDFQIYLRPYYCLPNIAVVMTIFQVPLGVCYLVIFLM